MKVASTSPDERAILHSIRRRLSVPDAAEEVLQSVYLELLRQGRNHGPQVYREVWFLERVNQEIRNFEMRIHRSRARSAEISDLDDLALGPAAAEFPGACVHEALRSMAREEARLIVWIDLQGQRRADMARVLGVTFREISVRHGRALAKLRILLQEQCHACRVACCPYGSIGRHSA